MFFEMINLGFLWILWMSIQFDFFFFFLMKSLFRLFLPIFLHMKSKDLCSLRAFLPHYPVVTKGNKEFIVFFLFSIFYHTAKFKNPSSIIFSKIKVARVSFHIFQMETLRIAHDHFNLLFFIFKHNVVFSLGVLQQSKCWVSSSSKFSQVHLSSMFLNFFESLRNEILQTFFFSSKKGI